MTGGTTTVPVASTEVMSAVERLRGVAVRTPMFTSPAADALLGRRVWVKAENLQRTGSFKLRGAYNALACLDGNRRAAGVIAASSGNHAHALAAHLHQVSATVVIPADAPAAKREAIEALARASSPTTAVGTGGTRSSTGSLCATGR